MGKYRAINLKRIHLTDVASVVTADADTGFVTRFMCIVARIRPVLVHRIMDSLSRASYEVTVATGLEKIAANEAHSKLNCITRTEQGKVLFCTPNDPLEVISLRTVDNVYNVLIRQTLPQMPSDSGDDLTSKLTELLEAADWKTGIAVWKKVVNFNNATVDEILAEGEKNVEIKPKFRVTCYRAGDHKFQSPEAARVLGGLLNDKYKWPVSMKQFDLQVMLHVKNNSWYISICLTRESLHFRNLVSLGVTTLKATVCHAMLRIARIKCGEIVCDPCAGTGAIVVESAISLGVNCFNLSADQHPEAVKHLTKNIPWAESHKPHGPLDGLECDSTSFPIRNASIDVIITDLPFGKRLGSKAHNRELYPQLLSEMARCTVPTTSRVVLLTLDFKNIRLCLNMSQISCYFRLRSTIPMKLGNLQTNIYLLERGPRIWSDEDAVKSS